MDLKAFQMLEYINNRLNNIEKNIANLDEKIEFSIQLQRNHLIRIKHGETVDDNMILMGQPYNDLSPKSSYSVYKNADMDYIIVDVSHEKSKPKVHIEGVIRIPLEELVTRYSELQTKTTPILIISEKGLRSIQACELLVKKGYFNINNVSGGYHFWPEAGTANKLKAA
ncbi:MAG: rhodanese-like domain-containing protein [Halobacteriovoraceae bacterium]|nr:rhodanese-like domain-containing protein [Halobacteriovoraceae bacterium]